MKRSTLLLICLLVFVLLVGGAAAWMYFSPAGALAPVTAEDDAVTVELPTGRWTDDLGTVHVGPKTLTLTHVPLGRLPRYARTETEK